MLEVSERSAIVVSLDLIALRVQLSEVLGKFNELSAEMTAQRHVIDQLVANNGDGGVSND